MAKISEEININMLEKKEDNTYLKKNPSTVAEQVRESKAKNFVSSTEKENITLNQEGLEKANRDIIRLSIQLGILGRSPENNGIFFDTLVEGANETIARMEGRAVTQTELSAGDSLVSVDLAEEFEEGQVVALLDGDNFESKAIQSIQGNEISLDAVEKPYKRGAYLAQSSVSIRHGKMLPGDWGTYKISAG